MYVGEKQYELIDSEMGRFVRKFSEFELFLRNVAVAVDPDMSWTKASLLRISELLEVWVSARDRFPPQDEPVLGQSMEFAEEVVKLRHLLVHGRWYEVDPGRGEFMLELPMLERAAKKFNTPPTWTPGSHPATVMPVNPATVARAWRLTRNLVSYIEENLDRWQAHFRDATSTA